jgi:hypothetical protein
MGAIVVAIFPPIICMIFTKDVQLTRTQNAVENRGTSSRHVDDEED